MTFRRTFLAATHTLIAIALFAGIAAAQSAAGSVQVQFRVLTNAGTGSSKDLPDDLRDISKELSKLFGPTELTVSETYYGRIDAGGSVEHKTVSHLKNDVEAGNPSFFEWSIRELGVGKAEGPASFTLGGFKFGARLPVKIGAVTNYEPVGLSLYRITLREGVPTLVGTLSMPEPKGRMFLVLTLTSTAN